MSREAAEVRPIATCIEGIGEGFRVGCEAGLVEAGKSFVLSHVLKV